MAVFINREKIWHRYYLKGIEYPCSPCSVTPKEEIIKTSDNYLSHRKPINIKFILIGYLVYLIGLIIFLLFSNYDSSISSAIFLLSSIIAISLLVMITYREHNFKSYIKENFKTFRLFTPFLNATYNKSGFRKAGYVKCRGNLNYYLFNKKISMYGISIYRRAYPLSPFTNLRNWHLESNESPEFSGIYTIINNTMSRYDYEIISEINETNKYTNLLLKTDLYSVYTKDQISEDHMFINIIDFLTDMYYKHGTLFDIKSHNNKVYIRSYNNCFISYDTKSDDKTMDFACNLQYFSIQNDLIKIIMKNTWK